jgi:hypothetical protein
MVSSTITTQGSTITNYLIGTNTNITITLADNLFLSGYLKVGETTAANITYTINASTPGNYISVGTNFQFVNGSTGIVINGTAAILIGNNTTPCNVSDTTFNNVSVYNTIYIQGNVIFGAAFRLFGAIYFSDFPSDFKYPPIVTATPVNFGNTAAGQDVSVVLKTVTTSQIQGIVKFGVGGTASVAVNLIVVGIPN